MKLKFDDKNEKFTSYEVPASITQNLETNQVVLQFKDTLRVIECPDREASDRIYERILESIDTSLRRYFVLPSKDDDHISIITEAPKKIDLNHWIAEGKETWRINIDGKDFDFYTEKEYKAVWTDLLKFLEAVGD
jgi:hypothetical protein